MLKPNEKIYIDCVLCHTAEDSYADGESLNQSRSWTHRDLQMDRTVGYATVGEALAAVCMFNFLHYRKENWTNFGVECGEPGEYSRFETDTLVRDDGAEASPSEIEDWKRGKRRLWSCHVSAYLVVRAEPRALTEDEAKSWS